MVDQSTWNFMQFLLVFTEASVQKFKVIFWVVQKTEISTYSALKPARICETVITETSVTVTCYTGILNTTVKLLLTLIQFECKQLGYLCINRNKDQFQGRMMNWLQCPSVSLSVAQVTHCIVNSVCNSTTWNTRTESNKKRH